MAKSEKKKFFFELFRPRVNCGRKQRVDLQNFVPEGHPNRGALFNSQEINLKVLDLG